jgi:hypothetical protein
MVPLSVHEAIAALTVFPTDDTGDAHVQVLSRVEAGCHRQAHLAGDDEPITWSSYAHPQGVIKFSDT